MKDPGLLEFEAVLFNDTDNMDVLAIEFPYDAESLFGVRGQVKVKASFDGVPYRGSLAKMGRKCHFLIVTKAIRQHLNGKQAGDTVWVNIQLDTEPRVVELPEDFQALLDVNPDELSWFKALAYTHQKEYVQWITEAKRPETRERRLTGTLEMLREKKKNPSEKNKP